MEDRESFIVGTGACPCHATFQRRRSPAPTDMGFKLDGLKPIVPAPPLPQLSCLFLHRTAIIHEGSIAFNYDVSTKMQQSDSGTRLDTNVFYTKSEILLAHARGCA
jgi:hypothetical protein